MLLTRFHVVKRAVMRSNMLLTRSDVVFSKLYIQNSENSHIKVLVFRSLSLTLNDQRDSILH